MAKVKLNPVLEHMRGDIGDLVFKKYGDRTIVSRKADLSGVKPSEAQQAHRQRFSQAALYGKMVLADPQTKGLYEEVAKKKGQPVFSLTVADFFNAPMVDEVDLSGYSGQVGETILVRAHDDFQVTDVTVTLARTDGTAIEKGDAVLSPSGLWAYTTTQTVVEGTTVRIEVTVTDRPGGAGLLTEEMTL